MSSAKHTFLFASLDSKQPRTARNVHIRRLYDILMLCIQRHDIVRAKRAWSVLIRCKEVDWKAMWRTGLLLLDEAPEGEADPPSERLAYLSTLMLQHPEERESIIRELVLRMIMAGQHRKALDELELYLPSPPYQDDPILHVYAGLICLYLAQPAATVSNVNEEPNNPQSTWNDNILRNAQGHFERAKILDPNNLVATAWLETLPTLVRRPNRDIHESDEENMLVDDISQRYKRPRA